MKGSSGALPTSLALDAVAVNKLVRELGQAAPAQVGAADAHDQKEQDDRGLFRVPVAVANDEVEQLQELAWGDRLGLLLLSVLRQQTERGQHLVGQRELQSQVLAQPGKGLDPGSRDRLALLPLVV